LAGQQEELSVTIRFGLERIAGGFRLAVLVGVIAGFGVVQLAPVHVLADNGVTAMNQSS